MLVALKFKVPSFVSLIWPALFLSLAYNFFDYGVHGGVNVAAGFVVWDRLRAHGGRAAALGRAASLARLRPRARGRPEAVARLRHRQPPWAARSSAIKLLDRLGRTPNQDLTESLERLDELHKSGALDDLEYAKAKDRVIRGESA